MNRRSKIVFAVTLLTIGLLAAWCLDVSVTTLNVGGVLTNGWVIRNPIQMYHIALETICFILFLMVLLIIDLVIKEDR